MLLVLDTTFLLGEISLADSSEVFSRLNVIFFKLPVLLLGILELRYFPLILGFGHHVAQV